MEQSQDKKPTKPFRWTVLVFDDTSYEGILDYNNLFAAGIVSPDPKIKFFTHSVPDNAVWVECEDGYLFDMLVCRYVTTAREVLAGSISVGSRHSVASRVEPVNLSRRKFDYAFLDWKDLIINNFRDKQYGSGEGAQLQGFILGLAVRRDNPRAVIVLMSAFSEEVEGKFEARWVRDILSGDLTLDISRDVGATKLSAFAHPRLRELERTRAADRLLSEPGALLMRARELASLTRRVAAAPGELAKRATIKRQMTETPVENWAPGVISEMMKHVRGIFNANLGGVCFDWLYPFHFARIYKQLDYECKRIVSIMASGSLTLSHLDEFVSDVLPTLQSRFGAGRDLAHGICSTQVPYTVMCKGLHPHTADDLAAIARDLPTLKTKLLREAAAEANEQTQQAFEDVKQAFEAVVNEILGICERAHNGDYEAAADDVTALNHKRLRFFPLQLAESALAQQSGRQHWWSKKGDNHFALVDSEPSEDWTPSLKAIYIYGLAEHAERALNALFTEMRVVHSVCARIEWLPTSKTLMCQVSVTTGAPGFDLARLERVIGAGGGFREVAARLQMHFAVAVGNERAAVPFGSSAPDTFESGDEFVVSLLFSIRVEDHQGYVPPTLKGEVR